MAKKEIQIFVFRQEHLVQNLTIINGFKPISVFSTTSKKIYNLVNTNKKSFLESLSKTETLIHNDVVYSGKYHFLKKISPENLCQLLFSYHYPLEQKNTLEAISDDAELMRYLRSWQPRLNEMCLVFKRSKLG